MRWCSRVCWMRKYRSQRFNHGRRSPVPLYLRNSILSVVGEGLLLIFHHLDSGDHSVAVGRLLGSARPEVGRRSGVVAALSALGSDRPTAGVGAFTLYRTREAAALRLGNKSHKKGKQTSKIMHA
jgi:hypothetical protein